MWTSAKKLRFCGMATVGFSTLGLWFSILALITGEAGLYVPLGMTFICIAMMFASLCMPEKKKSNSHPPVKKADP